MAHHTEIPDGMSRGSATRTIVIVGSLVVVALVGVIIALVLVLLGRSQPAPVGLDNEPQQRTRVINEDNAVDVVEEIVREPPTPLGYYEVSMNTNWYFPDGASPSSNAFVENVATNTNDVYFDVQLRDTQETIYESPVIPLGAYLDVIQLNRVFDAGTYDCVIIYHLINERQETLSTLSMGLTVIVES